MKKNLILASSLIGCTLHFDIINRILEGGLGINRSLLTQEKALGEKIVGQGAFWKNYVETHFKDFLKKFSLRCLEI